MKIKLSSVINTDIKCSFDIEEAILEIGEGKERRFIIIKEGKLYERIYFYNKKDVKFVELNLSQGYAGENPSKICSSKRKGDD